VNDGLLKSPLSKVAEEESVWFVPAPVVLAVRVTMLPEAGCPPQIGSLQLG